MKVWDYKNTKEEAAKYSTRGEFQKENQSAYASARRNGWLDDICSHMQPLKKKWAYEEVHQIALQYSSNIEMQRENPKAWYAAQRNGWWKQVSTHMTWYRPKWSLESIRSEALKFQTRKEFQKKSESAYQAAREMGVLDEVCSHMQTQFRWTFDLVHREALKYKTRTDFSKGSSGAYDRAKNNKWLDEVCSHMERLWEQKWDFETCKTEALKYQHRKDFQNAVPGAYGSASRNGWLEEVCSHMTNKAIIWDLETLRAEAKKYKTRSDFSDGSGGAYKTASEMGVLDEICGHMEILHNGYNHCVYAIYNKRTNEAYVGVTSQRFQDRMTQHQSGTDTTRSRTIAHLDDTIFEQQTDYIYPPEDVKKVETRFMEEFKSRGFTILNSKKAVGGVGYSRPYWTFEMVVREAIKFSSRWEFQKSSKAYAVAKRKGWLEDVCKHMKSPKKSMGYWTLENCKKEASSCSSVSEFKQKHSYGYKKVLENKWGDIVWGCLKQ